MTSPALAAKDGCFPGSGPRRERRGDLASRRRRPLPSLWTTDPKSRGLGPANGSSMRKKNLSVNGSL